MNCVFRTIQFLRLIPAGGERRKSMFTYILRSLCGVQSVHRYRLNHFSIQRQMSSNSPQTKRQKMEKVCYTVAHRHLLSMMTLNTAKRR